MASSQVSARTKKSQPVTAGFGSCPLPIFQHPQIVLGHGSGGKLTADLIDQIFLPAFQNPVLDKLDDQAVVTIGGARLAFTTDSFVVTPIFFPGGDIGRLAVHGTVNDLAMSGARPLYLSAAFILEEGLAVDDLRRVVESMRAAAAEAGVEFVTGDTKVVNRGKGDQIFITTTGIGVIESGVNISADRARPGDQIILSGYIGDHGMAIMSQRENLEFEGAIASDCASLNGLVAGHAQHSNRRRAGVHPLSARSHARRRSHHVERNRQARRRGNVFARTIDSCARFGQGCVRSAGAGSRSTSPTRESCWRSLHRRWRKPCLGRCNSTSLGRDAAIIGEVVAEHPGMVLMKTQIGGTRVLDVMFGEQLPRIC